MSKDNLWKIEIARDYCRTLQNSSNIAASVFGALFSYFYFYFQSSVLYRILASVILASIAWLWLTNLEKQKYINDKILKPLEAGRKIRIFEEIAKMDRGDFDDFREELKKDPYTRFSTNWFIIHKRYVVLAILLFLILFPDIWALLKQLLFPVISYMFCAFFP